MVLENMQTMSTASWQSTFDKQTQNSHRISCEGQNSAGAPQNSPSADDCSPVLRLLWKANSFIMQGLRPATGPPALPLFAGGQQVGLVLPEVATLLRQYPGVFLQQGGALLLHPQLTTYSARSAAVASALQDVRLSGATLALRAWRNENFAVYGAWGRPLLEVERSAMVLLGLRSYGVHVTGYTRNSQGRVAAIWLQKRADDKPTYPGMLDTMVGGGIPAGLRPAQVVQKEGAEEAGLTEAQAGRAVAAGTVSFFMQSPRGLHANTEHVFDLEVPEDFTPLNADGEVQGFLRVPVENIMDYLLSPNYKLSSVPVLVDFLVRHGVLTSDHLEDFPEVVEMLHAPLSSLYRCWPLGPSPPASPLPSPCASCPPLSSSATQTSTAEEGSVICASCRETESSDVSHVSRQTQPWETPPTSDDAMSSGESVEPPMF